MINATPLKPAVNNVNNASLNFGATIKPSKTSIFAAKPQKDEFVPSKKEEKKTGFFEKVKNFFALPQKKEAVAVKK